MAYDNQFSPVQDDFAYQQMTTLSDYCNISTLPGDMNVFNEQLQHQANDTLQEKKADTPQTTLDPGFSPNTHNILLDNKNQGYDDKDNDNGLLFDENVSIDSSEIERWLKREEQSLQCTLPQLQDNFESFNPELQLPEYQSVTSPLQQSTFTQLQPNMTQLQPIMTQQQPGVSPMQQSAYTQIQSAPEQQQPITAQQQLIPTSLQFITTNLQATTTNLQTTTTNHQATATNHQVTTSQHQPTTTNRQATTTNHQATTTNHQATTTNHLATTTNLQATTNVHIPTATMHPETIQNHLATCKPETASPYLQPDTPQQAHYSRKRTSLKAVNKVSNGLFHLSLPYSLVH